MSNYTDDLTAVNAEVIKVADAREAAVRAELAPPTPSGDETPNQSAVAIQVMPHRKDLSYDQHDKVLDLLGRLEIKRVRGFLGPATDQRTLDFYRAANERFGIRVWFTIGEPHDVLTAAQWDKIEGFITGPLDGMVALATGWNEPNHIRNQGHAPAGWERDCADHQIELHKRLSPHVETGSPQLWSGNLDTHDKDLKILAPHIRIDGVNQFDRIVWHLYQSGSKPFDRYDALYHDLFGDDVPVACTEMGMSTAPNQTSGAESMTEEGQAEYLPGQIALYRDKDYWCNWFELMDEPNPAGDDREDWLGIVRADWTPKPAFDVLRDDVLLVGAGR